MNGQQMCEHIRMAKIVRNKSTKEFATSWDQIWNYSATGELFMLPVWYGWACLVLGPFEFGDGDGI
jgi:hypothetical protein